MKHLSEDQLILYHYGELDDSQKARHHLEDCAGCRAELAAIEQLLAGVVPDPVPERPADYGQRVWRQLESETGNDRSGPDGPVVVPAPSCSHCSFGWRKKAENQKE